MRGVTWEDNIHHFENLKKKRYLSRSQRHQSHISKPSSVENTKLFSLYTVLFLSLSFEIQSLLFVDNPVVLSLFRCQI